MSITITTANFATPSDSKALRLLMQHYACDPMGGGVALSDHVLQKLPAKLASYPNSFSAIAWQDDCAVGLINCFEGFSTFKASPLLNIHDLIVLDRFRGQGVSRQLLAFAEQEAICRGCCKLTLEVLEGNARAKRVYVGAGFQSYELDPMYGQALFMEKTL